MGRFRVPLIVVFALCLGVTGGGNTRVSDSSLYAV